DELGEFANSFNKMTENLSKVTVSKDYVDNIIKSMIDTLIVTDPNGNIRTVNKATEELLGYKEDELIGKPVRILFAEEETLSKGTKWEKLLNEGSVRNYEMTYRTKNGENIPVTFSGSVMKDKDGNLVGIVGIARDMREIKQLQSQVIQSSKLAAIGELASGLAHELGNPLQTILGNADLLLIDNLGSEELMAIKNASVYSKKIIEGLLDFSRQRELKFVCGDINTVIEKTLLLYGKQLELKKVKIAKNYAQLPPILISPPHLEQVFLNLITNAQSAMPEGGTLTISTNVVARPWRVEKEAIQGIATTKENKIEHIEISFKDTGSGISKENLNRIFEPFFTTKKDGTGLGLSISYGIVKQHGGEIVAFSDGEGKGTEFV
ncbi:MAG: PAS domain S-box protein, partial [Elusimicrobiota bacterium]